MSLVVLLLLALAMPLNAAIGGYMGQPPVPSTISATNLVHVATGGNEGFELGSTSGWSTSGTVVSNSSLIGGCHSGSYCLSLTGGTLSLAFTLAQTESLPVEPNQYIYYHISFWINNQSSDGSLELRLLDLYQGANRVLCKTQNAPTNMAAGVWVQLACNVPALASSTTSIAIISSSGPVYIDDFVVTAFMPPAVRTWLEYPNYRGLLWSDGPQTCKEHVWLGPDTSDPNGYLTGYLTVELQDHTSHSVLARTTVNPLPATCNKQGTNQGTGSNTCKDFDVAVDCSGVAGQSDREGDLITTLRYGSGSTLSDEQPPIRCLEPGFSCSPATPAPSWLVVARGAFPDGLLTVFDRNNVEWVQESTATCTANSANLTANLTAASGLWTATNLPTWKVGEPIKILGCGAGAGVLGSYITSISGATITIANSAQTTQSSGQSFWVGRSIQGAYTTSQTGTYSPTFPSSTKDGELSKNGWQMMDRGDSMTALGHGLEQLGPFTITDISSQSDSSKQSWINDQPTVGWLGNWWVWDDVFQATGTTTLMAGNASISIRPFGYATTSSYQNGDWVVVNHGGAYDLALLARISCTQVGGFCQSVNGSVAMTLSAAPSCSSIVTAGQPLCNLAGYSAINVLGAPTMASSQATQYPNSYYDHQASLFVNNNNVTSYYNCDECQDDETAPTISPILMMEAYDRLRTGDPNHPVWGTLYAPAGTGEWWDYLYVFDYFGSDVYPVNTPNANYTSGSMEGPPWDMQASYQETKAFVTATHRSRPVIVINQAFQGLQHGCHSGNPAIVSCFPSRAEMLQQILGTIIAGGRGQIAWNYGDDDAGAHVWPNPYGPVPGIDANYPAHMTCSTTAGVNTFNSCTPSTNGFFTVNQFVASAAIPGIAFGDVASGFVTSSTSSSLNISGENNIMGSTTGTVVSNPDQIFTVMKSVHSELAILEPALTGTDDTWASSSSSDIALRALDGSDGNKYLIAMNVGCAAPDASGSGTHDCYPDRAGGTDGAALLVGTATSYYVPQYGSGGTPTDHSDGMTITLTTSPLPASVSVIGENRSISVNPTGQFTDGFSAFGVHAYELVGAQGAPTPTPTPMLQTNIVDYR